MSVLTLLIALTILPVFAQEGELSEEEVIERILELQASIDELLAGLPPERRDEIRRHLASGTIEAPEAPPETVPNPPVAPSAVAPSAASPPSPPPPSPPPPPPPRPRRPGRKVCNTLEAFDTNEDGMVDALDRYWRHLYLWLDRNRNSQMEKREIVSTFNEKVKDIATDLDSFSTFKRGRGEIRVGERILLDLRGNGFDSERSRDDAVLLVDASALGRGTGPVLLSASGQPVSGIQPFEKGLRLRDSEGNVIRLNCP